MTKKEFHTKQLRLVLGSLEGNYFADLRRIAKELHKIADGIGDIYTNKHLEKYQHTRNYKNFERRVREIQAQRTNG